MGDGLLAEFLSVLEAVNWAVEVQTKVAEFDTDARDDQRIVYRVGVNLGDIIVDGDDIFGDGVNVAARLQEIAEPGGVCISEKVHTEVYGKLGVGVYGRRFAGSKKYCPACPCLALVRTIRQIPCRKVRPREPHCLCPTNHPSPYYHSTTCRGDPEQEFFSDGMTEDIITALSRIRQLFVMARNTSFTFKGRSIDVQTVARDLGVRYVLEGSVRKAGNRVRITAQLINGATGNHLWAERYDRELDDIFAVQDEITQVVAGALEPEITKAEFERVRRTPPGNLDAWSRYQLGMHHFHQHTAADLEMAKEHFRAAIALDPSFSAPHASLARSYTRGAMTVFSLDMEEQMELAVAAAKEAVSLDREDAYAHASLGFALHYLDANTAVRAFTQALSINPNLAVAHFGIAMAYISGGQPEPAQPHLETAMRLSPRDPQAYLFSGTMGIAYFALEDYEAAIEWSSKGRHDRTSLGRFDTMRVAAFAHLGREAEMVQERDDLIELIPHLTISRAVSINPGMGPSYAEGLRKAGLPE